MGEKTGFSGASETLQEKKKEKRENALASLGFLSVTSGYYLQTFSLITLFFTSILCVFFYLNTISTIKISEELFKTYGSDFLKTTAATVSGSVGTGKYSNITKLIKNLYEQQDPQKKQIQEIFLLDKKGSILAHTDLTRITSTANMSVNRLSSIYNNELFHSALMVPENEIYIQNYPYEHFNKDRGFIYLLRYILPDNYFDAVDFSMPYFIKKQPAGTFHIVMSRVYMDEVLKSALFITAYVWLASIFFAAFLSLLFKIPISKKLNKLNNFVRNYLTQDVDQYIEKVEKQKIREEIEYIDAKIADLTKTALKAQNNPAKPSSTIKDAYLIREH